MKKQISEKINRLSDGVLALAGIYSSPNPHSRPAGNSKSGKAIFTGVNTASSANTDAGAVLIHALAAFVVPFHVTDDADRRAMEYLIKVSTDKKFVATLDKEHLDRNGEKFAATLIRGIGAPTSHALAAVTALKLYDHWGVMSPAQKSLSIAAMGIQLHKTSEGNAICDKKIISGDSTFTVSDALGMLQQGKNPYPLVQNWEQFYRLIKVYNEKPTNEALADFASSHNLLGKGANDGAVGGVSKSLIDSAGARPAPQYGVGALHAPKRNVPPQGYQTVAQTQNSEVIVPQANASTAQGALQGSLLGTQGGNNGVSSDSVATYKKWKKEDAKTQDKGSLGGSQLVAGLSALKQSEPYLYSAMVAFLARYAHESIERDNPAQYIAALAGVALARIVAGKSEAKADKEGIALAKQVHESTPADFAKLQVNMRALYANFGVSSKADAYQLSNQAYSEGRIDETDLVSMHEIFNLIYDQDSFGQLGKLLQGRDKGLQVAKLNISITNHMTEGESKKHKALTSTQPEKNDFVKRNQAKYQAPSQEEVTQQNGVV